jgi:hypothetical protein
VTGTSRIGKGDSYRGLKRRMEEEKVLIYGETRTARLWDVVVESDIG